MKPIPNLTAIVDTALKIATENGKVGRYAIYREIASALNCSWQTVRRHAIKSSYRTKVKSAAGRQRIFNHEEILAEILSGKRRDDICQAYGCKRNLLSKIYWKHLMEGK